MTAVMHFSAAFASIGEIRGVTSLSSQTLGVPSNLYEDLRGPKKYENPRVGRKSSNMRQQRQQREPLQNCFRLLLFKNHSAAIRIRGHWRQFAADFSASL